MSVHAPVSPLQASQGTEASLVNEFGSISISGGVNFFGSQFNNQPGGQQRNGAPSSNPLSEAANAMLRSLAFAEEWSRFEQIRDAFDDTYEWIFDSNAKSDMDNDGHAVGFVDWLQSAGTVFWISGKAGSGKSTLMKFILEHDGLESNLKQWSGSRPFLTPCYFFWRAGTPAQKSVTGLVRSLLGQVIHRFPEFATAIKTPHSRRPEPEPWVFKRASSTLLQALKTSDASFCFFVDGLDEFSGDEESQDNMVALINDIAELPNAKVCVSSRPEVYFNDMFGQMQRLHLQDLTFSDMQTTATGRLFQQPRFEAQAQGNSKLADEVIRTLCTRAEGVFLWLYLAIEDVIRGIKRHETLGDSLARVHSLGPTLNELFSDLLERVDLIHRRQIAQVVRLMTDLEEQTNSWGDTFCGGLVAEQFSMLLAALNSSPALVAPLLEATATDVLNDTSIASRCFKALYQFSENLYERSMGFLEVWASRDGAQCKGRGVDQCICVSGCGPLETHFGLYKLLNHFQLRRAEFVHRSAYDFFRSNERGLQYLADYTLKSVRGIEPCLQAIKTITQASLKSFCAATLSELHRVAIASCHNESLSVRQRIKCIQDCYMNIQKPLERFEIDTLALVSLKPPIDAPGVPYTSVAKYAHDSIRDLFRKDQALLLNTFDEVQAVCADLMAMLGRFEQDADCVSTRPTGPALRKNVYFTSVGTMHIQKSAISGMFAELKMMLERTQTNVRHWRLFATVDDDDEAASRASLSQVISSNSASNYIRSGGVAGLLIVDAVLHGARIKACLPECKGAQFPRPATDAACLHAWSLRCLQSVLCISERCQTQDQSTILAAIEAFLLEDVDKSTALAFVKCAIGGGRASILYLRLDASLQTLIEDILVLTASDRQRLLEATATRKLEKRWSYDALAIPTFARYDEIVAVRDPTQATTLADAELQQKANGLVLSFVRSLKHSYLYDGEEFKIGRQLGRFLVEQGLRLEFEDKSMDVGVIPDGEDGDAVDGRDASHDNDDSIS